MIIPRPEHRMEEIGLAEQRVWYQLAEVKFSGPDRNWSYKRDKARGIFQAEEEGNILIPSLPFFYPARNRLSLGLTGVSSPFRQK